MKFTQAVVLASAASATLVSAVPTKAPAAAAATKAIAKPVAATNKTNPAVGATGNGHHKKGHKQDDKARTHHHADGAAGRATHGKKTTHKHSKAGSALNTTAPASAAPATKPAKSIIARDLLEELESLDARDLEELEELIARGRFTGIANTAKKGFTALRNAAKGKKWNTFLGAAGVAGTVGSTVGVYEAQKKQQQQQQKRDFDEFEYLAARDFDDLESLDARDFDIDELDARDIDIEELDARDLEELAELIARGRFTGVANVAKKGFTAVRNAAKGKKWNTFMNAASIGATVGSTVGVYKAQQNQQRDFDDMIESLEARGFDLEDLDARDLEEIEELLARGRFSGAINVARKGFNAVRKAMKGHKMDAVMAAGTVASFIPSKSKDQQQKRDLEDFDELEMRDFDFDLNELD